MWAMTHPTTDDLMALLPCIAESPQDSGTVDLIVARPEIDEREVLTVGILRRGTGLDGDNYVERGSPHTPDGHAHPEAQLNVMMSRALDAVSGGERSLWPLAGDQLIVDFDLSEETAPVGTRLAVGSAVIEVSPKPHRGCAKFAQRFGQDAVRWVNHDPSLRLRGVNAVVVSGGEVRTGDAIRKI